jgi:hypothetical protein
VVGVRRRRTQLLDDLRNRRRYWELKLMIGKDGNDSLPIEQKKEIQVIFHNSMDLLEIAFIIIPLKDR